ncbi:similar to rRNA methylase [Cyanidioschyzon merolae strain 10D]|uniref:Similar to rRNA methylase n=1 Tax=Cyanidioschyzon merolae (strain NIES-3377 / 10D) TaxID=280699 RepID=M1V7W8_CYAM1|nr:similar to rRNA methylase [Cyanidioschyzon merolae strain 10D]BAM83460.1 similar to rRNA methylase [Cyanidioschyzon merolae strain 10D]|eukprot:XP_005539496.1 similar to rRNA methylase [Cyanidioschyzon merolae strain 10D]
MRCLCWTNALDPLYRLAGRQALRLRGHQSWWRYQHCMLHQRAQACTGAERSAQWSLIRSAQNAKLKLLRQILRKGSLVLDSPSASSSLGSSAPDRRFLQLVKERESENSYTAALAERCLRPQLFVVEGARLLQDALDVHWAPEFIICSADAVQGLWRRHPQLMGKISTDGLLQQRTFVCETELPTETVHSQGIVGVFQRKWLPWDQQRTLVLFLDGVQDPGNLGTILRSACAAGCRTLLLSDQCVDAWSSKVVRAGMGAHFRQCIVDKVSLEHLECLLDLLVMVPGTDAPCCASREAHSAAEVKEAGLKPPASDRGHNLSRIHHHGQRYRFVIAHPKKVPGLAHFSYDDDAIWLRASNLDAKKTRATGTAGKIPPHRDIRTPTLDILVIGNEAHGPSAAIFDFAQSVTGSCTVAIPLDSGVESLNAAAAASILLFEARRQRQKFEESTGAAETL